MSFRARAARTLISRPRMAPTDPLASLAALLREGENVISPYVRTPRSRRRWALLAAAGPRAADAPDEYVLLVEAIREGYLLHYETPTADPGRGSDLRLLAGDYLYALGLERLAARGDLEAVRELADLISLEAQLHAENGACPAPMQARALWLAATVAVAVGGSAAARAGQGVAARGERGAAARLIETRGRNGPPGGHRRRAGPRSRVDRLRPRTSRIVADEGNDKQGAPDGLPSPTPPGYFEGESMTRRTALTVGVQAVGGLAGAGGRPPRDRLLGRAALRGARPSRWQSVGPISDFSPDTYRPVVITAVPGIGETGKTTAYIRQGNPEITEGQDKYPAESPDEYIAISTRCAHLGCPVRFVEAAGNFICPCHGGVYGFLGERIGGPPVRPLDRFQTRVTNGQVELGPRFSVTNGLDPVRARDPGEFTGGVWEYLYPPRPSVPPPP